MYYIFGRILSCTYTTSTDGRRGGSRRPYHWKNERKAVACNVLFVDQRSPRPNRYSYVNCPTRNVRCDIIFPDVSECSRGRPTHGFFFRVKNTVNGRIEPVQVTNTIILFKVDGGDLFDRRLGNVNGQLTDLSTKCVFLFETLKLKLFKTELFFK